MVPLIVSPHPWLGLDLNASIYSTRYRVQGSCEGLYPRYETLDARGGAWWVAARQDGVLVGLASAVPAGADVATIDAFTHPFAATSTLRDLYDTAAAWARGRGLRPRAVSLDGDSAKAAWLAASGYVGVECTAAATTAPIRWWTPPASGPTATS